MKHEWYKKEKEINLPKNKPVRIQIPEFGFFTIEGEGNPNNDFFAEYIGVLYSLSYAIKMSPKKGIEPEGYFDYTVYPLEGVWDISEEAKKTFSGKIDKNDLIFNLMIRQPDFVDDEPESFQKMENFAGKENLNRISKVHREIYLSDARKVEPAKLKTVLRFKVENK